MNNGHSENRNAYWLINHFSGCQPDDAKLHIDASGEAIESLIYGVGFIGKLLIAAGANDDAAESITPSDLVDLGAFLKNLSRMQAGLHDAHSNLEYSLKKAKADA